mgnify:CR=1 FL=1
MYRLTMVAAFPKLAATILAAGGLFEAVLQMIVDGL